MKHSRRISRKIPGSSQQDPHCNIEVLPHVSANCQSCPRLKKMPISGTICDGVTESSRAKGQTEDLSQAGWQCVTFLSLYISTCVTPYCPLFFARPSGAADAVTSTRIHLFFHFPMQEPTSPCNSQARRNGSDRGLRVAGGGRGSFKSRHGLAGIVSSRTPSPHTHLHSLEYQKLRGIFFRGSATPEDPFWRMIHSQLSSLWTNVFYGVLGGFSRIVSLQFSVSVGTR